MLRVMIPLLLICLIMDWKYLGEKTVNYQIESQNRTNFDYECGLNSNPLSAIESVYKQSA